MNVELEEKVIEIIYPERDELVAPICDSDIIYDDEVTLQEEVPEEVPEDLKDDDDECKCEATIFYNKYKKIITQYFDKFLDKSEPGKKDINELEVLKNIQSTIEGYLKEKDEKETTEDKKPVKISTRSSKADEKRIGKIDVPFKSGMQVINKIIEGDKDTDTDQSDYLEFYQQALDVKMQRLFDENMSSGEEKHTEKGYCMFDRSDQSTVLKLSSREPTMEGSVEEEEYQLEEEPSQWISESMRAAMGYLNNRKIDDLFKFLGAHLVSSSPCNPIHFLIDLLEQCIAFRAGHGEPPLLFRPEHVESLFNSMDPMMTGFIEIHQYHTAMFTFGIKDYNMFPKLTKTNLVAKHVFIDEALKCLKIQLLSMLQTGLPAIPASTLTPRMWGG